MGTTGKLPQRTTVDSFFHRDCRDRGLISKDEAFDSLRQELDVLTGASTRAAAGQNASTRNLTDREAEVFGLIGDGLSTRQIAERLRLSEHTVQTHRKRIATKLRTTGDELVRRAVAHRANHRSAGPPSPPPAVRTATTRAGNPGGAAGRR